MSKGSFKEVNIRDVCGEIRNSGINIITHIFGFPDDDFETMQKTLDLALELNTEMVNMYPCQALPGSPLYNQARNEGWSYQVHPRSLLFSHMSLNQCELGISLQSKC